jgi:hypothetical protein
MARSMDTETTTKQSRNPSSDHAQVSCRTVKKHLKANPISELAFYGVGLGLGPPDLQEKPAGELPQA